MKREKKSLTLLMTRQKVERSKSSLNKVMSAQLPNADVSWLRFQQYQKRSSLQPQLEDFQEENFQNQNYQKSQSLNLEQMPSIGKSILVTKFIQQYKKMNQSLVVVRDEEQPQFGNLLELRNRKIIRIQTDNSFFQTDQLESDNILVQTKSQNQIIRSLSQQILEVKDKRNANCRPTMNKEIIFDKSSSILFINRKKKRDNNLSKLCKMIKQGEPQFELKLVPKEEECSSGNLKEKELIKKQEFARKLQ